MTEAPTLRTERLVLRAPRLSDYEAYAAMWSEPEVLRFTQRVAPAPEMMWTRFVRAAGFWPILGFGVFTVEERSTGAFVGQVGFFDARREIEPSLAGLAEAGWTLSRAFHGRGYGLEATSALMEWSARALAGRRAVAIIDPDNAPSRALAVRHGFGAAGETAYRGDPVLLFDRIL